MQFILSYNSDRNCVEGMYCSYDEEEALACRVAAKYPDVIYFFAEVGCPDDLKLAWARGYSSGTHDEQIEKWDSVNPYEEV